jgi:hypothetical protein
MQQSFGIRSGGIKARSRDLLKAAIRLIDGDEIVDCRTVHSTSLGRMLKTSVAYFLGTSAKCGPASDRTLVG